MHHDRFEGLPVAVIGAGLVGLAAAARLAARGLPFVVLEAGDRPGASIREWGHVRLFTPWADDIDPVARRALQASGWDEPPGMDHPTGHEVVDRYLEPLASLPQIGRHVRYGHRVTGVARAGLGKLQRTDRELVPFKIAATGSGGPTLLAARAVLDASGTWGQPNPLGADGLIAPGELAARDLVTYGIPDVLGADRAAHAGAHTVVVGSGHSAQNVVCDLARLASEAPGTRISWVVRRDDPGPMFDGTRSDPLSARASLTAAAAKLVRHRGVDLIAGFAIDEVVRTGSTVTLRAATRSVGPADRVVATTGFRPDLALVRELHVDLDPALESPRAIRPLIDPELHSCATVPVHGAAELAHPEPGFYTVGMKSYGRAPTFLARTGYAQLRSVVAALSGDPGDIEGGTTNQPIGCCGDDGLGCGPVPTDSSGRVARSLAGP